MMDMKRVKEIEEVYKPDDEDVFAFEANSVRENVDFLIQTIKQQQDQITRYENALIFYADKDNYKNVFPSDSWGPVIEVKRDEGKTARIALEHTP